MFKLVNRFLASLEEEQDRSVNTTSAYRNDLSQFTRFVADLCMDGCMDDHPPVRSWREVDSALVDRYVAWLHAQPYASATKARKVAAMKSYFHWLEVQGVITPNPAQGIEAPKVKRSTPQPIEAEEIERLLAEAGRDQSPMGLRDKALVETLFASGMRVTEVVNLNLDDLLLDERKLHCSGKHSRAVPLADDAFHALHRWLAEGRPNLDPLPAEPALFLNHRGQRLTRQGLWLVIKRYVKQVGIKAPVTPHTLRQSFATHQLRRGVGINELSLLLGHASRQTTQNYRRAVVDTPKHHRPSLIIDGKPYTPPQE